MSLYQEKKIMSYYDAKQLDRVTIGGGAYLTGHHIIPDHCFYVCSGGRNAQGVQSMQMMGTVLYRTDDAPVILLSSDISGGKTLHHGAVHDHFDSIEKISAGKVWTYEVVRDLAIQSVLTVFSDLDGDTIKAQLDNYYLTQIGLQLNTPLRCGEHTSLAGSEYAPLKRTSDRKSRKPKPY